MTPTAAAGGSRREGPSGGASAVAIAVLLAGAALRIAFLGSLRENYDLVSFRMAAEVVRRGGALYREVVRYNYSPVWAYVVAGLDWARGAFGVSLARAITSLLLLADVATAAVLYRIARGRGASAARAGGAAALFFANPVSVVVSSLRGMFDAISILFLILSIHLMERKPARKAGAVAAMSASVLVKHVTWFHPLLLARRGSPRLRLAAALVPYAVFFASFLPFWSSRERVLAQVFRYQGLSEPYGVDALRRLAWIPTWGLPALCAAAALLAAFWLARRGVELGRASLLLFLVLLVFLPGITPYYFVWPIALGALDPSAGFAVYTAVVTLFLIHSPDAIGVELSHLPGWSGPWWAAVLWLLWEIRALTRRRPEASPAAA
ncbi:MAG TPA: hypothetical protein VIA45_10565 [Thermoanaerobaculia bacterium]